MTEEHLIELPSHLMRVRKTSLVILYVVTYKNTPTFFWPGEVIKNINILHKFCSFD